MLCTCAKGRHRWSTRNHHGGSAQPYSPQFLADGAARGKLRVAVLHVGQSVVATGQRNRWTHRLDGHPTCVARTSTRGMVEHGLGGWHGHCRSGSTAGDACASGRGPPLVVLFDNPGWGYIGLPVAVGSLMLVMIAWLYHRLPPRIIYPTPEQE